MHPCFFQSDAVFQVPAPVELPAFPKKTPRLSLAPWARFYPASATTRTGTRRLRTQSQCSAKSILSTFSWDVSNTSTLALGTTSHVKKKKASVDNSAEVQCQQLRRAARGRFARHSPDTDRALAPETGRGPPIAPSHGSKMGRDLPPLPNTRVFLNPPERSGYDCQPRAFASG